MGGSQLRYLESFHVYGQEVPWSRPHGWIKGEIHGYEYYLKAYEKPSQFGIDGGLISKLEIRKDDAVLAHYDRGWDIEPVGEDARSIMELLQLAYGQPD